MKFNGRMSQAEIKGKKNQLHKVMWNAFAHADFESNDYMKHGIFITKQNIDAICCVRVSANACFHQLCIHN